MCGGRQQQWRRQRSTGSGGRHLFPVCSQALVFPLRDRRLCRHLTTTQVRQGPPQVRSRCQSQKGRAVMATGRGVAAGGGDAMLENVRLHVNRPAIALISPPPQLSC